MKKILDISRSPVSDSPDGYPTQYATHNFNNGCPLLLSCLEIIYYVFKGTSCHTFKPFKKGVFGPYSNIVKNVTLLNYSLQHFNKKYTDNPVHIFKFKFKIFLKYSHYLRKNNCFIGLFRTV